MTIEGQELIEMLPVMDNRNRSIPLEQVTSFDVNKAIQRSLTKAAARHGLGLYIYAGEDLPEEDAKQAKEETANVMKTAVAEMSSVQSRTEMQAVWSKYATLHPTICENGTEFYQAAVAAGTKFPKAS